MFFSVQAGSHKTNGPLSTRAVPAVFACAALTSLCASRFARFGSVLCVSSQAIYIQRGESLVCLSLPQAGNMFYGALVAKEHWPLLQQGLTVGDDVYCEKASLIFPGTASVLDLNTAEKWQFTLPRSIADESVRQLRYEINLLLASCSGAARPASAMLAEKLLIRARSASQAFYLGKVQEAAVAMRDMLGLGFGLTPSGDDYCLGLLAAFNILNSAGYAERVGKLSSFAAGINQGLTTKVSAWLLSLALKSIFPQRIQDIMFAAEQGSSKAMHLACWALGQVGASSGQDILQGMAVALEQVRPNPAVTGQVGQTDQ